MLEEQDYRTLEEQFAKNAGGAAAPAVRGCSYKTFLNCKPHPFNGNEGVVGLTQWFEKMESTFEISKCAEEDMRFQSERLAQAWW
nr:reverse transcriptase domain-containing protein [Tanacetum cinerariifolium]